MIPRYLLDPRLLWKNRTGAIRYVIDRLGHQAYRLGHAPDANARALRSLRDRHLGRRGFVIGNGPSLTIADLERLEGEITFASNKIYLAFDETLWRPTFYSVEDVLVAANNQKEIAQLRLENQVFSAATWPWFRSSENILFMTDRINPRRGEIVEYQFSTDLLAGSYGGASVIYRQLQLAWYLGLRELYVIGLDFSFTVPERTGEQSVSGQVVQSRGEVNHFHKDYRRPGETWTVPRMDSQIASFTVARDHFARNGGSIRNASRESRLEVFERVELDTVLA